MPDSKYPPNVQRMANFLSERYAFMGGVIDSGYSEFGETWLANLDQIIGKMMPDEESLAGAARGYVKFAVDAIRLQNRFEREGKYINKTYAEASSEVYQNEKYMMSLYLPGILLSHFFWPHHYRQKLFFESQFLSEMKRRDARYFADVGIGTGFYSTMMLNALPSIRGHGFDVSPLSKRHALSMTRAFGVEERYGVRLGDLREDTPENSTEWLVSVEVLEHLEQPLEFLSHLRKMLRKPGKAFITAALNAANADHIYLYSTPLEVKEQLEQVGFTVEQYQSGYAYPPRRKGQLIPEITAFIVT